MIASAGASTGTEGGGSSIGEESGGSDTGGEGGGSGTGEEGGGSGIGEGGGPGTGEESGRSPGTEGSSYSDVVCGGGKVLNKLETGFRTRTQERLMDSVARFKLSFALNDNSQQ
jgi:hypothetical protein